MRKNQENGRDLHERVSVFQLIDTDHTAGEGWLRDGDVAWLCLRIIGNSRDPRTGKFRRSWYRTSEYVTI